MKKTSWRKYRGLAVALAVVAFIIHIILFTKGYDYPLLRPSGWVGEQQRNLLVFTAILSLFVIIPVFYMLFSFTNKYNETKKAKYEPELDNNVGVEVLWWAVPVILITILGVVTFKTSHSLDPFKPLVSDKQPITVQVVALPWKWLFIYPEQRVASVNYVKMPVDRPVEFKITSDAPMNSFWIPDLGGQIYAMAGMESEINLIANKPGEYPGLSANLSGSGFSDMKFVASAVNQEEFDKWIIESQNDPDNFNQSNYDELVKPSKANSVEIYHLGDPDIFKNVLHKFMNHGSESTTTEGSY